MQIPNHSNPLFSNPSTLIKIFFKIITRLILLACLLSWFKLISLIQSQPCPHGPPFPFKYVLGPTSQEKCSLETINSFLSVFVLCSPLYTHTWRTQKLLRVERRSRIKSFNVWTLCTYLDTLALLFLRCVTFENLFKFSKIPFCKGLKPSLHMTMSPLCYYPQVAPHYLQGRAHPLMESMQGSS